MEKAILLFKLVFNFLLLDIRDSKVLLNLSKKGVIRSLRAKSYDSFVSEEMFLKGLFGNKDSEGRVYCNSLAKMFLSSWRSMAFNIFGEDSYFN